jgi:adenylate cyclase
MVLRLRLSHHAFRSLRLLPRRLLLSLPPKVPPQTTAAFFFALNFAAVSSIVYLLLRYSDSEKHRAQQRLQEAHRLLQVEQERSERLLLNILPGRLPSA